jgi:hypothetical protein
LLVESLRTCWAAGTFTDVASSSCFISFGFNGSPNAKPTNVDAMTPAIGESTQMYRWLPAPWPIAS